MLGTFTLQDVPDLESNLVVYGGTVGITGDTVFGQDGTGTVTIDDFATVSTGNLIVGKETNSLGDVDISGQGKLYTNDAILGDEISSTGDVNIDGGEWEACGDIHVGNFGTGNLTVKNGWVDVCANLNVGVFGEVTAENAGNIGVDGTTTIQAGGMVTIKAAGRVDTEQLVNEPYGTIAIERNGLLISPNATNEGAIFTDGKAVGRFINENLLIVGGEEPQIGRFIIDGEFEQYAGGTTKMEIDGTAQDIDYDALHVVSETGPGSALLGGTLDVSCSYSPQAWNLGGNGDMFSVLTATGSLSGEFDTLNLPSAASGKSWVVVYDGMDSYDEILADEYPLFEDNQPWVGNGLYEVVLLLAEREVFIDDVTVYEGDINGYASLNVQLSIPSDGNVMVDFDTQDGTAVASNDYFVTSLHPIAFADGESSYTVDVPLVNDNIAESTETFDGLLTNAVDATIRGGQAVITILDDDFGPAAFTVSELAQVDDMVGSVWSGTVPQPFESFSYMVTSGNSAFRVESDGTIYVDGPLNYDAYASYDLEITLTDDDYLVSDSTIYVTIDIIDESVGSFPSSFTVSERAQVDDFVGDVWTAIPQPYESYSYWITSGNSAFRVDDGAIYVDGPLNYDAYSSYDLEISLIDDDFSSVEHTFTVTIDITDESVGSFPSSFTVSELAQVDDFVGDVWTAIPQPYESYSYWITSGNSAFRVDDGAIYVDGPLNYDAYSSYDLEISLIDDDFSGVEHTFTVTIDITDEFVGSFPSSFTVSELAQVDDFVGDVWTAIPQPYESYSYWITSGNSAFRVDDGAIYVDGPLNYDAYSSYDLEISLIDDDFSGAEHTFTVTIDVTDESPGSFTTYFTVSESAPLDFVVGSIWSSIPQPYESHGYSITMGDSALRVESDGMIYVDGPLDYDNYSSYELEIWLIDDDFSGVEYVFTVTVDVLDSP